MARVQPNASNAKRKAEAGPDPALYRAEWGRRSQQARAFVRDGILTGRFPVGEPIADAEVASELGISTTPAREALKLLEQEGLLERGPGRRLLVRGFTDEHRAEVFDTRRALEQVAVRRACGSLSEDEVDQLRLSLVRQRRAVQNADESAFIELDEDFHLQIARGGGAQIVGRLLGQLGNFVRVMHVDLERSPDELLHVIAEHERIVDALEAGDAEAAVAALDEHLALAGGLAP